MMHLNLSNGRLISLVLATILLFALLLFSFLGRATYTGELLLLVVNAGGIKNGTVDVNSDLQFLNEVSLRNVKKHALGSRLTDRADDLRVTWLARKNLAFSDSLKLKLASFMASQKKSSLARELINLQNPRGLYKELADKNVLTLLIRFQSNNRANVDKVLGLSRDAVKAYFIQKQVRSFQERLEHLPSTDELLTVKENQIISQWSKRPCFLWRDFPDDVVVSLINLRHRIAGETHDINFIQNQLGLYQHIEARLPSLVEYLQKSVDVEFRIQKLINDIFRLRPMESTTCEKNRHATLLADFLAASDALSVYKKQLFTKVYNGDNFGSVGLYSPFEAELIQYQSKHSFVELGQDVRQEKTSLIPMRDLLLIIALWAIALLAYSRRWLVDRLSNFFHKP